MEKLLGLRRRDLLEGARDLQTDLATVQAYLASLLRPVSTTTEGESQIDEEGVSEPVGGDLAEEEVNIDAEQRTDEQLPTAVEDSPPPPPPVVFDSQTVDILIQRICQECVFLTKLFLSWSDRIIIHHIIQTRVEHLCFLQFLMQRYDSEMSAYLYIHHDVNQILFLHQGIGMETGNVYTIVTMTLFKLFALLHGIVGHDVEEVGDEDVVQFVVRNSLKPTESTLPEGRSNWYTIAFTTISKVLADILLRRPMLRQVVFNTTQSHYVDIYGTWTTSSLWQVQYLSLVLIHSSLAVEYFQATALPSTQNHVQASGVGGAGNAASVGLKKGSSSANLTSQQSTKKLTTETKSTKTLSRLPSKKSVGSSSSSAIPNSTSSKANAATISIGKDSEELCRMGYLRCVTWFLTHKHFLVRKCAAEILLLLTRLAGMNASTSMLWSCCVEQGIVPLLESIAIGREVYAIQEPPSETDEIDIHQLSQNKANGLQACTTFPEETIRNTALYCLGHVATYLERDPNSDDQTSSRGMRQRLLTALTHSGNSKLRINILTGILFLASRSPSLGKMLWDGDEESPFPPPPVSTTSLSSKVLPRANLQNTSGKHHIMQMLQSIVNHDVSEIKQILHLMIYFLHLSMKLHLHQTETSTAKSVLHNSAGENSGMEIDHRMGNGQVLEDDNSTIFTTANQDSIAVDDFVKEWLDRINPVILVGNTSSSSSGPIQNNNLLQANRMMTGGLAAVIKMVCPLLPIVEKHCVALSKEIKDYHQVQLRECCVILSYRQTGGMEKEIKTVLSHNTMLDEKCFLKLHGSYTLWQEIFSHMTDSFLMKQSIARMTLPQLLEAFSIATHYHMPHLIQAYIVALQERVAVNTIVQIMPSIMFERSKHNLAAMQRVAASLPQISNQNIGVHLALCLRCIEFLRSSWDEIRKKLPPPQFHSLLQQVSQIMSLFLL